MDLFTSTRGELKISCAFVKGREAHATLPYLSPFFLSRTPEGVTRGIFAVGAFVGHEGDGGSDRSSWAGPG